MKFRGNFLRGIHSNRWRQQRIACALKFIGAHGRFRFEIRDLSRRVHARIRASGRMHTLGRLLRQLFEHIGKRALHGALAPAATATRKNLSHRKQ